MLKQFLSTLIIFNILFVTSGFSQVISTSSELKPCSYHFGKHNKLKPGKCETDFADATIPGVGEIVLGFDFKDRRKALNTVEDIKKFYSGDEKACLACSGVSKNELDEVKNKLLKLTSIQRNRYGATILRDAVVSNEVAFDDYSKTTQARKRFLLKDNISCREEFEELTSDEHCVARLSDSLKFILDIDASKSALSDSKTLLDSIQNKRMLVVNGSNNDKVSNMYNGIKKTKESEELDSEETKGAKLNYSYSASLFSMKNKHDDTEASIPGIRLVDIQALYESTKEKVANKLSNINSEKFENYCSNDKRGILPEIENEVKILDSYVNFKGQLNKVSLCSYFVSNKDKIKKNLTKFDSKKLYKVFSKHNQDLTKSLKTNCQNALKKVKKYVCEDYTNIDQSVFYNDHSQYGSHPFYDSYSIANDEDKLKYKAFACLYGEFASVADYIEKERSQENFPWRKEKKEGVVESFGGSFLVDASTSQKNISSESLGSSQEKSSPLNETVSSTKSEASAGTPSTKGSNYFDPTAINPIENNRQAYNSSILNNGSINRKSDVLTEKNKQQGNSSNRSTKDDGLGENYKLRREIEQLNADKDKSNKLIEQLKADAAFDEEKQNKLKELESLNNQIADLKDQKDIAEKSENKNISKSKTSNFEPVSQPIPSVENTPVTSYSEQKVQEAYQVFSSAKTLKEKKQALNTSFVKESLDASYKNDLTVALASDNTKLDVQVKKIVNDMIRNKAISQIQIIEKDGVEVVVFEDQSKEFALDNFSQGTQTLLKKYVSFLKSGKLEEKRSTLVDLGLVKQLSARYSSFREEFESVLESQEE